MSTVATYGRGKALVVQTGMQTEIGKIAEMIQSFEDQAYTASERNLKQFGKVAWCSLSCGLCLCIRSWRVYNGYRDGTLDAQEIQLMFMTAISLAVAAIPEGLPAVVTIVLAIGMQRMVKKEFHRKKTACRRNTWQHHCNLQR